MRKNDTKHRRIFERHHGRKIRPGYHIHHIDGDHNNNDPLNLIEVTPMEHYQIHKAQGDYAACILLATVAGVDADELGVLQRLHGVKCAERKIGIHSDDYDHSALAREIWQTAPPGRQPVTDGTRVVKLKTDDQVEDFLRANPGWRRGVPPAMKCGLALSQRRITSEESKQIAMKRLDEGTHNFMTVHSCPHCGKDGKGPMMFRWHFDNCKERKIL